MKCVCGHCHCPICGNQMTEAKVTRLTALREVREMVRECEQANDPEFVHDAYARKSECHHIGEKIDAMIKDERTKEGTMPTVTLTESQLRLINNLLLNHLADGSWWGKNRDHEKLVLMTSKIIERALAEVKP